MVASITTYNKGRKNRNSLIILDIYSAFFQEGLADGDQRHAKSHKAVIS